MESITWHQLQKELKKCDTVEKVEALMKTERETANRARWLLRMQGRLNVLRNEKETAEILKTAN